MPLLKKILSFIQKKEPAAVGLAPMLPHIGPTIRPEVMYWCSFRSHDDTFLGVVIARGTSPGRAASSSIDRLELPSCKASIVAIPSQYEIGMEKYQDRLLDAETSEFLLGKLGIRAVLS